jgi:hypothetical protein
MIVGVPTEDLVGSNAFADGTTKFFEGGNNERQI